MTYSVREIYYTLQGEGAQTGRPAVFLRFAGCNLWSGREQHRSEAICRFCDTEFVGTDGPGGGNAGVYAVSVAWRGGVELVSPETSQCGAGSANYGDGDTYRRVVQVATFIDPNF